MNIYCIEQNYLSHKRERNENKNEPIVFLKPGSSLLPNGMDLHFEEPETFKLYAQCEIVLKISSDGKDIPEAEAEKYFDSISTGINFTRINIHDELSGAIVKWEEAKAWNHSSSIGEWFDAADFVKNPHDINFCLYKNREMEQMGNTDLMVFDLKKIISLVSSQYALKKDDIIFTGSPLGICEVFEGDKLEAFLEDDSALEFGIVNQQS
jgi:2-keto-4-pentenoate hydratase/2-oxohepta-3-ene-1,7-dioic acid hydratase in catechol pathway